MTTSKWNLDAPQGFQGLRDDLPLRCYIQLLPHWRQEGATYFVTFRLNDALPAEKLRQLHRWKEKWERLLETNPETHPTDEMQRMIDQKIEDWLDQGTGSCVLKSKDTRVLLVTELLADRGTNYELGCFVTMPNHVHAIVRPMGSDDQELEDILRLWKGRSARTINKHLGISGPLWQRESYDRIIRDEEHLWRILQYIGRNPAKANLPTDHFDLWINPEWAKLGWNFQT